MTLFHSFFSLFLIVCQSYLLLICTRPKKNVRKVTCSTPTVRTVKASSSKKESSPQPPDIPPPPIGTATMALDATQAEPAPEEHPHHPPMQQQQQQQQQQPPKATPQKQPAQLQRKEDKNGDSRRNSKRHSKRAEKTAGGQKTVATITTPVLLGPKRKKQASQMSAATTQGEGDASKEVVEKPNSVGAEPEFLPSDHDDDTLRCVKSIRKN